MTIFFIGTEKHYEHYAKTRGFQRGGPQGACLGRDIVWCGSMTTARGRHPTDDDEIVLYNASFDGASRRQRHEWNDIYEYLTFNQLNLEGNERRTK